MASDATGLHIVLLPGLDGTGRLFLPLLEVLPRWIVPHVISYPTTRPLGYDALLAYVRERVPAEGRFVLLGESFSGPLAIRLSAELPDRVIATILVATFATSPLAPLVSWLARLIARPALFRMTPPRALLRWWFLSRKPAPGLLDLMRDSIAMVAPEVMACRINELLRVDALDDLRRSGQPVLYLAARHDRVVAPRCCHEIAATASAVTIKSLDGPHLILQSAPAAALRQIVSFLAGVID